MSYRKRRGSGRSSWKTRVSDPCCTSCGAEQSDHWTPKPDDPTKQMCVTCAANGKQSNNSSESDLSAASSSSENCPDLSASGAEQQKTAATNNDEEKPDISNKASNGSNAAKTNPQIAALSLPARRASSRNTGRPISATNPDRNSPLPFAGAKATKGRANRRAMAFKAKKPAKAPKRRATIRTIEICWHGDSCFRIGDVVSIEDEQDGLLYFAQLRALLTDQYCKSFGSLTWLLPTADAPADGTFQEDTFVSGPNDETLYPIESLEYVCRPHSLTRKWSPTDTYRNCNTAV